MLSEPTEIHKLRLPARAASIHCGVHKFIEAGDCRCVPPPSGGVGEEICSLSILGGLPSALAHSRCNMHPGLPESLPKFCTTALELPRGPQCEAQPCTPHHTVCLLLSGDMAPMWHV